MLQIQGELKPAVRQRTLEHIVRLLYETFLDFYRIKKMPHPYLYGESGASEAAESETAYGKTKIIM